MVLLVGSLHNTYALKLKYVTFIKNYAEIYGLILPEIILDYKRIDIQILPSYMTENNMNSYSSDNEPSTRHIAGYVASSTFRKSVPQIITTIPRSDMCCICWRNSVVNSQDTNSFKSHKL